MIEEVKKKPADWCLKLGARVINPDGWRNTSKSWEEECTRSDFDRLLNMSTIDSSGYPSFNQGLTFISHI